MTHIASNMVQNTEAIATTIKKCFALTKFPAAKMIAEFSFYETDPCCLFYMRRNCNESAVGG